MFGTLCVNGIMRKKRVNQAKGAGAGAGRAGDVPFMLARQTAMDAAHFSRHAHRSARVVEDLRACLQLFANFRDPLLRLRRLGIRFQGRSRTLVKLKVQISVRREPLACVLMLSRMCFHAFAPICSLAHTCLLSCVCAPIQACSHMCALMSMLSFVCSRIFVFSCVCFRIDRPITARPTTCKRSTKNKSDLPEIWS